MTGKSFRAEVSHDHCTGTGRCVHTAPRAFRFNPERLSVFVADGGWTRGEVREAADACPMSAITVFEDDERSVTG